jgi:hypothetical protein
MQRPWRGCAARMAAAGLALAAFVAGCGPKLSVGSDVLWSATFESDSFSEWTDVGRGPEAFPEAGDSTVVSKDRPHDGTYSAKLTIDTSIAGEQQNTLLSRVGNLPVQGYYSAWYYLPSAVTVGTYWVIFKFRLRTNASDDSTTTEFYDLDLINSSPGQMSLILYNHRTAVHEIPLDVPHPSVPVGAWFQIESFYRNMPDNTGQLTFWLDGQKIIDIDGQPMAPTSWIELEVCSIGVDLMPSPAVIYIDDCALSQTRVGTTGEIAN